jgi:hypothetical protein
VRYGRPCLCLDPAGTTARVQGYGKAAPVVELSRQP